MALASGMNGSINDHSASVMLLAWRKPLRRYFRRVISLQGIVNSRNNDGITTN